MRGDGRAFSPQSTAYDESGWSWQWGIGKSSIDDGKVPHLNLPGQAVGVGLSLQPWHRSFRSLVVSFSCRLSSLGSSARRVYSPYVCQWMIYSDLIKLPNLFEMRSANLLYHLKGFVAWTVLFLYNGRLYSSVEASLPIFDRSNIMRIYLICISRVTLVTRN